MEYEELSYGEDDVLDATAAIVQAAKALDTAFMNAVEWCDRETMVTVAGLWIRLAENLATAQEEDEEEKEPEETTSLGFQQGKGVMKIDESE